jgi:enoyl-[acyl-carrier-protein] reductase (NADH)
MVSFLASDKARMITGQSMIVDGGKFGTSIICCGKLLTKYYQGIVFS